MSISTEKKRLLKRATLASLATVCILIVVKLAAWLVTGSVSILASLVDSLMDSAASFVNLLAVRYSIMPADSEHRFGHGKAEPLAGLIQAGFICGSALFLVFHAIDRLRHPSPLESLEVGLAVMLFATVLTGALVFFQRYVIKHTQSTAIKADSLHYQADLLTNVTIMIALVLSNYGMGWADGIFAIGVAVYIFHSAISIGHTSFQQLMDRELPDDVKQQILDVALANPNVRGVHDFRSRQSGQIKFIQLHIEMDDDLRLVESHAIADEVEAAICEAFPDSEVIVHQDPVSLIETNHQF
jgi:ferrous-iron efflux pump FieF